MRRMLPLLALLLVLSLPCVAQPAPACPQGTVDYAGYCWVKSPSWGTSHEVACASVGLPASPYAVNVGWSEPVLSTIATQLGYTSIGDYAESAHAMWCNDSTMQCGTHDFGDPFENYGGYGDTAWIPVYTCLGGTIPALPPDVPLAGPGALALLAGLLAIAGVFTARRLL